MKYNVNKIYSFNIKDGVIDTISVYIDDLNKYKALEGYEAPQTSYNIAEFHGEDAIFRILEDIGFEQKFNLELNQNDYKVYTLLSEFISDEARVIFNGKQFYHPGRNLGLIKKVVLDELEFVEKIKLNFGEVNKYKYVTYEEYMFMYAVWSGVLSENELMIFLKKRDVVETHLGEAFNFYRSLETDNLKVAKRIVSTNGITITGIFLVDISKTLMRFKAIENGYNITYKEDIPKDSIFYMSNSTIALMQ